MTSKDSHWTSDAVERGDIAAIRQRVLAEPDYVHERDDAGDTPLLMAIAADQLELVRFLLEHGADPNVEVDDGYTCLLTAIESEKAVSLAIVAELIRAGADLRTPGSNGWTPLHMAASRGHVEQARLLLDAGAEVDRRTEIDGAVTPLMEAASSGHAKMVELLLAHGADPTLRAELTGRTALETARYMAKGPDANVVELLQTDAMQVDVDALWSDLLDDPELTPQQSKALRQSIKDLDMAQNYIDNANAIVAAGDHAEVIRLLEQHGK